MARWRKVDVRVWGDARVKRLTPIPPCGQGLWLYLLTSPDSTSIPGLFRAGEAAMAEALGWTLKGFREAFAEGFGEGLVKADWRARVVWIKNAIVYNPPENPNVVKSWRTAWDEIPECSLKDEAYETLKAFLEPFGKGFGEAFAKACRKGLANQEQEQEQEQEQKNSNNGNGSGGGGGHQRPARPKAGVLAPEVAAAADRYRAVFNASHKRNVIMPPEAVAMFAERAKDHPLETLIALPLLALAQGKNPQEIGTYLRVGDRGTYAWVPSMVQQADRTTLTQQQADIASKAGVLVHLTGTLHCKVKPAEPEDFEP